MTCVGAQLQTRAFVNETGSDAPPMIEDAMAASLAIGALKHIAKLLEAR